MVWEKDQGLAGLNCDVNCSSSPLITPASHSGKVAAFQDEIQSPKDKIFRKSKNIRSKNGISLSSQTDSILCTSSDDEHDSDQKIENDLFFRRLFKNNNTFSNNGNTNNKQLRSNYKTYKHSTWQTWFSNENNNSGHLFVELGHSNLAEYSRHDMVQLIDECTQDPKINQLIFFFNKNRNDIKNLNNVFRIMEFEILKKENLDRELDLNSQELNAGNFYWGFDAGNVESSEVEVFSEDDEDDLIF